MIRRLSSVASVLSLLMLVATLFLWFRSYRHADTLFFHASGHRGNQIAAYGCLTSSARGEVHFGIMDYPVTGGRGSFEWTGHVLRLLQHDVNDRAAALLPTPSAINPPGQSWRLAGFGWWHGLYSGEDRRAVVIPHPALATLFVLAPIRWMLRRFVRARARRQNRCLACGYDLRASIERCPECGTPLPATLVGCCPIHDAVQPSTEPLLLPLSQGEEEAKPLLQVKRNADAP